MTLENICELFDTYDILDNRIKLDKGYCSASTKIFTDGEITTEIRNNGFINIMALHNANYIMFIDPDNKTYLAIYKYISEDKFKEITYNLMELKKEIDISDDAEYDINKDSSIIDINNFKCTECDSKDELVFHKIKSNPEMLKTKCNKCKTEYIFAPSKYYKLSSKKIVYLKSDTSRNIKLGEPE